MHSNYYKNWQTNRVNYVVSEYGIDYFKNKKILELAPFNGFIGNAFYKLGAEVLCVEGRKENIAYINEVYPHLKVVQSDLDTESWVWGDFDIIINFGLLYHLEKHHEAHIVNCLNHCHDLILESVIYDSFDDEIFFRDEGGFDQSLSEKGGTPSTSFVENILNRNNAIFNKHITNKLDGDIHYYAWEDKNTKIHNATARRFWTIKTNSALKNL